MTVPESPKPLGAMGVASHGAGARLGPRVGWWCTDAGVLASHIGRRHSGE